MTNVVDRPVEALEFKRLDTLQTKLLPVPDDGEETGIVEALVAATGNVDQGKDLIEPGAFTFDRTPKIAWAHDLAELVGKVLEWEEWTPTDPRMIEAASDLAAKGIGGLWFKIQFDLSDPDSVKAYRKVLFHDDLGWSIGYSVNPDGATKDRDGVRHLKSITVWEASPLAFGMNESARTLDRKGLLDALAAKLPEDKATALEQILPYLDQVTAEEEADVEEEKVRPPLSGSFEETRDKIRAAAEEWAVAEYGERTDENYWWCSVDGTFPDRVIASFEVRGEGARSVQFGYAQAEDGTVTLTDPTDVEITTTVRGIRVIGADLDALLVAMVGEEKAGAVLSARNADAIRTALGKLQDVVAGAGVAETDEDDSKALERIGEDLKGLIADALADEETGDPPPPITEAKGLPAAALLEHLNRGGKLPTS